MVCSEFEFLRLLAVVVAVVEVSVGAVVLGEGLVRCEPEGNERSAGNEDALCEEECEVEAFDGEMAESGPKSLPTCEVMR